MPESERKTTHPEPPEVDEVEEVDESSDESFPASDPPSWAMGKRAEPQAGAGTRSGREAAAPPRRRSAEQSGLEGPGQQPQALSYPS